MMLMNPLLIHPAEPAHRTGSLANDPLLGEVGSDVAGFTFQTGVCVKDPQHDEFTRGEGGDPSPQSAFQRRASPASPW